MFKIKSVHVLDILSKPVFTRLKKIDVQLCKHEHRQQFRF